MGTEDPYTAKPSDQMPEEAPAEQVPDDRPDAPEGAARESALAHTRDARRHAGQRRHLRGDQNVGNHASPSVNQ